MAVALSMLLLVSTASATMLHSHLQQLVSCTATVTDATADLKLQNMATSSMVSGTIRNLNSKDPLEGPISAIQLRKGTPRMCEGQIVMWFCKDEDNFFAAPDATANCTTSDAPQTIGYQGQLNTQAFATLALAQDAISKDPSQFYLVVYGAAAQGNASRQAAQNPGLIRGQLFQEESSSSKGLLGLLGLLALIPLLLCCCLLSSLLGCCVRGKKQGANVPFATFDAAGANMTLPQTFVSAAPAATFLATPTVYAEPAFCAPTYIEAQGFGPQVFAPEGCVVEGFAPQGFAPQGFAPEFAGPAGPGLIY